MFDRFSSNLWPTYLSMLIFCMMLKKLMMMLTGFLPIHRILIQACCHCNAEGLGGHKNLPQKISFIFSESDNALKMDSLISPDNRSITHQSIFVLNSSDYKFTFSFAWIFTNLFARVAHLKSNLHPI